MTTNGDGLRITFEPYDEGARRVVVEGVDDFNIATTGLAAHHEVVHLLRDGDGEVLGGLLGFTWGSWLRVDHLWIAEAERGRGWARQLMAAAEAYAIRRGCRGAHLDTYSFQARPFYEKLGYVVVGQIDDMPPGHTAYFMEKRFAT